MKPTSRIVSISFSLMLIFALFFTNAHIAIAGPTSSTATLTLNVLNQNGLPAANWTWVDIYDSTGQYQMASGYLVDGSKSFPGLPNDNYYISVSSPNDHFLLTTSSAVASDTVVNLDARIGTVPITLNASDRNGDPLLGAYFSLAPQTMLEVSGRVGQGRLDETGELIATVSTGTYTIAALDTNRLYRLDLPNQVITAATSVTLDGSLIPTGELNVVLQGATHGQFRINRSPYIGTQLPITSTSSIIVSTGLLPADIEMYKTDGDDQQWTLGLSLPGSPFTVTNGSITSVTGGGILTALLSTGTKYQRGSTVDLTRTLRDANGNSLNYLVYAQDINDLEVPVILTVRDASNQPIYQNVVNVRDGSSSFTIPLTAVLGVATAMLTVDTGPFQGTLTAETTFEIKQPYRTNLPLVLKNTFSNGSCSTIPTLLSPANSTSLNTIAPLIRWNNGNNSSATTIRVQIAKNVNFSPLSFELWSFPTSGDDEYRFTINYDLSTTYYWRAWLMCGNVQGPYSAVWSFTTGAGGTILPEPTLIAPIHGSTVPSTTITLQWSAVPGAVEYLVKWRKSGQGGGSSVQWVNNTQITISGLDKTTSYEWWVYARNDYAIGTSSSTWLFITPAGALSSSSEDPNRASITEVGVNGTIEKNSSP